MAVPPKLYLHAHTITPATQAIVESDIVVETRRCRRQSYCNGGEWLAIFNLLFVSQRIVGSRFGVCMVSCCS